MTDRLHGAIGLDRTRVASITNFSGGAGPFDSPTAEISTSKGRSPSSPTDEIPKRASFSAVLGQHPTSGRIGSGRRNSTTPERSTTRTPGPSTMLRPWIFGFAIPEANLATSLSGQRRRNSAIRARSRLALECDAQSRPEFPAVGRRRRHPERLRPRKRFYQRSDRGEQIHDLTAGLRNTDRDCRVGRSLAGRAP